jgi:hypothetical protein
MKKIELNLDALQVESFEVGAEMEERGTVMGNQPRDAFVRTRGHSCARTGCCPETTLC